MPVPPYKTLEYTRYRLVDGQTFTFWREGSPDVNRGDVVHLSDTAP